MRNYRRITKTATRSDMDKLAFRHSYVGVPCHKGAPGVDKDDTDHKKLKKKRSAPRMKLRSHAQD